MIKGFFSGLWAIFLALSFMLIFFLQIILIILCVISIIDSGHKLSPFYYCISIAVTVILFLNWIYIYFTQDYKYRKIDDIITEKEELAKRKSIIEKNKKRGLLGSIFHRRKLEEQKRIKDLEDEFKEKTAEQVQAELQKVYSDFSKNNPEIAQKAKEKRIRQESKKRTIISRRYIKDDKRE